jgi:tetratricopeptide (TPR) repeat protein
MLRRLWRARAPRPRSAAELFAHADRLRRQGRAAEAARLVDAGLALDPNNLTGHLLAAYLHAAARTLEPARREFTWVLRRDPTHPRARLGLARLALEEGDVEACREALTQALRLYPDFPEAQALLGALAVRRPATTAASPPAAPLERVRLPGLAGAVVALHPDGDVIAARPDGASAHGERLGRAVSLAAAALASARLGPLRRAVLESAEVSYFMRADTALILALALPRTTQITQGTLEVNRLWAAVRPELGVRARPAPRATGTDGGARRVS